METNRLLDIYRSIAICFPSCVLQHEYVSTVKSFKYMIIDSVGGP